LPGLQGSKTIVFFVFFGVGPSKIVGIQRIGSENGCFLALNRYFDRQDCRYKNRDCDSLSEKPLQVPSTAAGKPQKELLLMASMGDVPHAPGMYSLLAVAILRLLFRRAFLSLKMPL